MKSHTMKCREEIPIDSSLIEFLRLTVSSGAPRSCSFSSGKVGKIINYWHFCDREKATMFRQILISLLFFVLAATGLRAQSDYFHQEFAIANENDVYTFKNTDRYYSNGILTHFRFIPQKASFLGIRQGDSTKRIIDIELTQKFFTPVDLTLNDFEDFDRPYAGWLYGGLTIADFPKRNRRIEYGLELGVVGRASGAEAFQTWYHRNFGFPRPRGWDFQIPNEVAVNLKVEYNHQWALVKSGKLDLISSSRLMLGTAFTNAVQRLDVRFGGLQTLDESGFVNAMIGRRRNDFKKHGYFFVGYGLQWTGHDVTIQGSLWNDDSPHTESIFSNIQHFRVGWAASSANTTFKMTYNWLSKEVKGARDHGYVGFELLLRFRPRK